VAGLFSKVARFASSPQGQAALAKAKAAANDPENRAKLDDLVSKVKGRAGGLGQSGNRPDRTGTTTTVTRVEPATGPAATRDLDGPAGADDSPRDTPPDSSRPAGS